MSMSEWLGRALRPMPWTKAQAWKMVVQGPVLVVLDVVFLIYINGSSGPAELRRRVGLDVVFGVGLIFLFVLLWISWKTVREPE